MKCDELKVYVPQDGPYGLEPEEGGEPVEETCYFKSCTVKMQEDDVVAEKDNEIRRLKRALWLMTAEWADAMGLASCNIANKFMSRENFEVSDDYRNKTIKKYRHRQVVFYKYADYCRKKAEEFK